MMELERQASQAPQHAVVLAVQDTTSFHFAKRKLAGLGVLDNNRPCGFFAHITLHVSCAGGVSGFLRELF
jgi:hypothetical protein